MLTLFQKWIPVFISFCKSLNNIKNKFMRSKLWIIPAACIYCLLISATSIKVSSKYTGEESKYYSAKISGSKSISPTKLNFFKRLIVGLILKKYKKAHRTDIAKADNLANISLLSGVAAISCMVLGLFVPFIIFATIPAAIIAMITGGAALRGGTKNTGKAKTGKILGLGSLIAFALLIIIVAVALSNTTF